MGSSSASGIAPRTVEPGPAIHDFDFYMGTWRVHHRRLKERLVGSDEWQEFEGTSTAWPLLDGAGNVDDNVLELPDGPYRAVSLRSFDPVGDVVDLVARWAQPGHPRPARRRPVQGRRGHVHRRRHPRRPADPRPVPVVGHHATGPAAGSRRSHPTAVRPGRSTGSWSPSESTSVRAPRSRPGRSRPQRSRRAPASSPAPRTPARVSVRTSSRPRHCCSEEHAWPTKTTRPSTLANAIRRQRCRLSTMCRMVARLEPPGCATASRPVRARCIGSQGGPSRSRSTAAAWPPADSAGSSWAHTGASRP